MRATSGADANAMSGALRVRRGGGGKEESHKKDENRRGERDWQGLNHPVSQRIFARTKASKSRVTIEWQRGVSLWDPSELENTQRAGGQSSFDEEETMCGGRNPCTGKTLYAAAG